ncbi:MAG: PAS domain S-box protein, partial [Deltaproteobacteria bacterium]|nr:PAS domain S-box protein [Deltaproteobacteria bacterium]
MKKTYKKKEEKLTSEGSELRQPVAELEAPATERKQTEEALRESEETKSAILNATPDFIAVVDKEGIVSDINKAMAEKFGKQPKEIIGSNSWYLIPPELAKSRKRYIDEVFQTGKPCRFEDENGGIYFDNIVYPIVEDQGKVTRVALQARDITERKQAEEKLQTILKTALDGFTIDNLEGKILEANDSYCKMVGYTRDELLKMSVADVEVIESPEETTQRIKIIKEQGFDRFETRHKRKDGKIIDVEVSVNHLDVGEGQLFIFARDITDRKRAEEALKESEQKYRTIFENVSEVIIRLDRYGKIVDINGRSEECFGYKPEEVIGKNFARIGVLSLKDLPKMVKLFGEIIRGKRAPFILELEAKRKDGSPVLIEVNSKLVEKDGKKEGFVTIVRDITERKRAEEKLETILKTALDGFWLTNLEGKILEVNDSYCKMVGYSREELLKMSIADLEAIESPQEVAQHIKGIIEQGYGRFESRHKHKDGKIIDVEISVNYLDVGEGQFFVFARDITERKRVEKALKAEKNKLQSLIDTMEDGLNIRDKDFNIIYQNEPVRRLYGDRIGEKCYRVYEGRDRVCDGCP